MRIHHFFCAFCLLLTFLIGCNKPESKTPRQSVKVSGIPYYGSSGNDPMFLDSVYQTPEGYLIKFTDFKFFLTNISGSGSLSIQSCFFDYRNSSSHLIDTIGQAAEFQSLNATIGVDSALNHLDPTLFPTESPLNIENAGLMHWGWNTGYIFILVEGKSDTIVDGTENLDHNFSFHVGTDLFQKPLQIDGLNWNTLDDSTSMANIKLDLFNLFHGSNPIDLKTEYLTHSGAGQKVLAEKVAENFKVCFTPF